MRKLTTGLLFTGAFCFCRVASAAASPAHVIYEHVINFKKGSSDLSKADKESIAALMKTVKDHGQVVEQVHIAAWSDKPFVNRELAMSRMNVIQDLFENTLSQNYVETYNMSERSNWFARAMAVLNSKDIKTMFSQKGAPQNVTPEDFAVVKAKGGPMKAVILLELEAQTMMAE